MSKRVSRAGWAIVIPAVLLGAWLAGSSILARRGQVRLGSLLGGQFGVSLGAEGEPGSENDRGPAVVERMDDPRLSALRKAADSWRKADTRSRLVVDQVWLVPDLPTFLEAIAAWDERHYFPILIDDPAWTLPFLRAFRPARVVKYARRRHTTDSPQPVARLGNSARGDAAWSKAVEAVSRACSSLAGTDAETHGGSPGSSTAPRTPGMVLADPESDTIGAAVALAAGHFQTLVRVGAYHLPPGARGAAESTRRFGDVLTVTEAWHFARQLEGRVSRVVARYDQLGDECDFLTLAGDWPYRYEIEEGEEPVRGIYALDDLIGRTLVGGPSIRGLEQSRRRWAYTGRIVGDQAASVARAMGALFLHPKSALLWNTYTGGKPWSTYTMKAATGHLSRVLPGPVEHVEGAQADLSRWHRMVDPANRFGLFLINSSGGPDFFSIAGGPGRAGDVPRGLPSAVAMIHSFSAADLNDSQTIASRWLANGAFVYFGSVREPFLLAFRPPALVAELIATEVPLVAALRQSELEPFGFPWRLVYLGDPLYRVTGRSPAHPSPTAKAKPGLKQRSAPTWSWWSTAADSSNLAEYRDSDRIDVSAWGKATASYDLPPLVPVVPTARETSPLAKVGEVESDSAQLESCLKAAMAEAVAGRRTGTDWRAPLRQVRREGLDESERRVFDSLLIDALQGVGALDELQDRLARIPPGEAGPSVWQAHEACAFGRLARLGADRSGKNFNSALRIWDEVMELSWPKASKFPGQLTERLAAMAAVDPGRRLALWQDQLRKTAEKLEAQRERYPHVRAIVAEQRRVEGQRVRQ